jgi:hypothetical protein
MALSHWTATLAGRLATPFVFSIVLHDNSPGIIRYPDGYKAWRMRSPTAEAMLAARSPERPPDTWTRRKWASL